MTDTPNHGYNRPKKGATDWHLALNENFENIDADIEIRGTEADKKDYEPKQEAKYEAIDSGAVYYGDGSSWSKADREVATLNRDNIISKPILVGDAKSGSHEYIGYDDLITAVANAPDQAEIIINGNVTVGETIQPTGTYLNLRGRGGFNRGDQTGMPSIRAESGFTGTHLIDLDKIGSKWGSIENINLFCQGNAPNGITTGNADNGLISHTSIYGASDDHLIEIRNGAFDNVIHRCFLNGKDLTDYCVRIWEPNENQNGGNEPKIIQSLIRGYNEGGVYVDNVGAVGLRMEDCSLRGGGSITGKYGLHIHNKGNTTHSVINRCQFERQDVAGVYYEGTAGAISNFKISNSTFNPGATHCLKAEGKAGNIIIGPFNLLACAMNVDLKSGSRGRVVSFMNLSSTNPYKTKNPDNPFSDQATAQLQANGPGPTLFEPLFDDPIFSLGGTEKLEFGQTSSGGNRTAKMRQNYVEVSQGSQKNLFQNQSNFGSFTVINRGNDTVGEFFNTNSISIKSQSGSEYTTSKGTANSTNIFREGGRVKIENKQGDGRYTAITRENHHR